MRRYLVVANQTLLGDQLLGEIAERIAAGPCRFHLVVPATHVPGRAVWTEGHDRAVAEERLQQALERFRCLGADVEGEVGDSRPIDARGRDAPWPPAEIIVSTPPTGLSRWLRQDMSHRIQRTWDLPLSVIVARAAA